MDQKPVARKLRTCCTAILLLGLLSPAATSAHDVPLMMKFPGVVPRTLHPADEARYQRVQEQGVVRVQAQFDDAQGKPQRIGFAIDAALGAESMRTFGFSPSEIQAMNERCNQAPDCSQAELDQSLDRYFRRHALRVTREPGQRARLSVDIPAVVRRHREHTQPVATALRALGEERGFDTYQMVAAAASLVQQALGYRTPSAQEDGRNTLGFYPPPRALEEGYGDCDTKSALLAAILANLGEDRIIGVRVPNHYLLGLAREPRPGDQHLKYEGRSYVLIEAAGPARRLPGDVAKATRTALLSGEPLRIDPIF